MKNKKRMLFVTDADYQNVINMLDKQGIKNWNETGRFYFHTLTAVVTAIVMVVIGIIISVLN